MEEPDVDELTWMAMDQQEGLEDEAQIANEPDLDDFLDSAPPPPPSEDFRQQTDAEGVCRKRNSPDSSVKSASKEFTPREKRCRAPFEQSVLARETIETSPLPGSVSSVRLNEDEVKNQPAECVVTGSRNICGVFRMANSVDGDYVTITAPSGVRVYAERKQSQESYTSETRGLLLHSIETMIEVAQHERLQKMFTEDPTSDDPKEDFVGQLVHVHEKLWVEKYAPKAFTELLSEEQTNREVPRLAI